MSKLDTSSTSSRYDSLAALLASEKLEDLNRFPASAPEVAVTGVTAGSLTNDIVDGDVPYYDEVLISSTGGGISETTSSTDADGKVVYTTITQTPDGKVTQSDPSPTAPAVDATMIRFKRRWLIEKDIPVANVRRVTVSVTSVTGGRANIQMSMVRP